MVYDTIYVKYDTLMLYDISLYRLSNEGGLNY